MKTIINWHKTNLKKKTEKNLPNAGETIFFSSDVGVSDISQIYHSKVIEIEYQPNKLFVTNSLGKTYEIKSGFVWCYPTDIETLETETEHPEITTIAQARKYAGISQMKMSKCLGIPRRSIEDWETGKRSPSPWAEKLVINELIKIKNAD